MRISTHVKIQTVISYLMSADPIRDGFSKFTREFISEYKDLDKPVYNLFMEQLDHIIEIMNPALVDYKFFTDMKLLLEEPYFKQRKPDGH